MTLVLERWKQKPVYVDSVILTDDNYREVGDWLGADIITVTIVNGESRRYHFRQSFPCSPNVDVHVRTGERIFKYEDPDKSSPRVRDVDEFKKEFKRI